MLWGWRHSVGPRTNVPRSVARHATSQIGLALSLVIAVGCQGAPAPSASPAPTTAIAAPSPTAAASPRSAPTPAASEAPVAELGPVGGVWRIRKILSLDDRSALVPGAAFDEEAYVVTPDCDDEPCPSIEVKMTPLGRSKPVSIATLERDGNHYVSAARAENEGPCLDEDGDPIRGGAKVTSIMRLWLSTVRASGSAVETTEMRGSLELNLNPTPVGSAAGCVAQTAAYELSGRREAVAVRDDPLPDVELPPNTAGGVANLPPISVKVNGAEVVYFEIEGDTVAELAASLANGGVQSCGAINYEWHEGDARPAACTVSAFPDIEDGVDQRVSSGSCTIARSTIRGKFAVHMPRWVAPKRVPKRLLAWWRDIVEFIRDHEAGHVDITLDHLERAEPVDWSARTARTRTRSSGGGPRTCRRRRRSTTASSIRSPGPRRPPATEPRPPRAAADRYSNSGQISASRPLSHTSCGPLVSDRPIREERDLADVVGDHAEARRAELVDEADLALRDAVLPEVEEAGEPTDIRQPERRSGCGDRAVEPNAGMGACRVAVAVEPGRQDDRLAPLLDKGHGPARDEKRAALFVCLDEWLGGEGRRGGDGGECERRECGPDGSIHSPDSFLSAWPGWYGGS